MNNRKTLLIAALVSLLGACTLGGPTTPSQFYLLSADPGEPLAQRLTSGRPLSLAIGPVSLPDIVDRPQIVTRVDANRVQLGEFDRWAGDINENLVSVLTQNLMARLNTQDVSAYPSQRSNNADFQIVLRFFRFDGQLGERAEIAGTWLLHDGNEGCQLEAHRFDISETAAGGSYADLVAAMSAAVAKLSQSIAGRVAAATPGCKSGE